MTRARPGGTTDMTKDGAMMKDGAMTKDGAMKGTTMTKLQRGARRTTRAFGRAALAAAASACLACQALFPAAPPPPVSAAGTAAVAPPTFALDPVSADAAYTRLSGKYVTDFSRSLVASPSRWKVQDEPGMPAPPPQRSLQALGDPATADWNNGIPLTTYGIAGTDVATNGAAMRNFNPKYPKRIFTVTRDGVFLGVDPDDALTTPTFQKVSLAPGASFTRTYVALSGEGTVAFVVSDQGKAYAIDVANPVDSNADGVPDTYNFKTFNLSGGASLGSAFFVDPLQSSIANAASTMYCVSTNGKACQVKFAVPAGTGGQMLSPTQFLGATFTETASAQLTTSAPLSGLATDRVKAAPVVLNGVLVVGDRRGMLHIYDFKSMTPVVSKVLNYGWPIETPVAVDVDNALNIVDVFVAAGSQLFWYKPATGIVYGGQYALLEKGAATNDVLNATNFGTYLNLNPARTLTASQPYSAFTTATSTTTNTVPLPKLGTDTLNTPDSLDWNRLSHSEFLQGQPPYIFHYAGIVGTRFNDFYNWTLTAVPAAIKYAVVATEPPTAYAGNTYVQPPVIDGVGVQAARLLSPSAIDFDDDGSAFVADTNHCQILFKPGTTSSWQRWFPASHTMAVNNAASEANFYWGARRPNEAGAPNNFYVMSGTLFGLPGGPMNDGSWAGLSGTGAATAGADASDPAPNAFAGKFRDIGNGSRGLTGLAAERAKGRVYAQPVIMGGNALTAGTTANLAPVARGAAINRPQGLAVGNLGLYFANRNAFSGGGYTPTGELIFIPRVGVTSAWGITNLQPGRQYVIANFGVAQGISVYKIGTNRDVVAYASMAGPAATNNRAFMLDSSTWTSAGTAATATVAATVSGTTGILSVPYDTSFDDYGNMFIANNGTDRVLMVNRVLPPQPGATFRSWGATVVAGGAAVTAATAAGTLCQLPPTLNDIATVTFAQNDPAVPSGCLYAGLSDPTNRVVRIGENGAIQTVAGPAYPATATSAGGTGDSVTPGGPFNLGTAATVWVPWRARGVLTGSTYTIYICDRFNNRIRMLESSSAAGNARGFLCFTQDALTYNKPIYNATLTLRTRTDVSAFGAVNPPRLGLAAPTLSGLPANTYWDNTAVGAAGFGAMTPMRAPAIDFEAGAAQPTLPVGAWTLAAGTTVKYRLPASAIHPSLSNEGRFLRLGMAEPVDDPAATRNFYYPSTLGTFAVPNIKAPDFWTASSTGVVTAPAASDQRPSVLVEYGQTAPTYPILSPPAIWYDDFGNRFVYVQNCNALFRYDVSTPQAFVTAARGAEVAWAKTFFGRTKTTLFNNLTFQFNATPPLITETGKVFSLDTWYNPATTKYSYSLNEMNGKLPPSNTNMYVNAATVASEITSSTAASGGVYLVAGGYQAFDGAFFGLGDGRLYRVKLQ